MGLDNWLVGYDQSPCLPNFSGCLVVTKKREATLRFGTDTILTSHPDTDEYSSKVYDHLK